MTKTRRRYTRINRSNIDLALNSAQTIANRMLTMGKANPTAADKKENVTMVTEKTEAFTQGWINAGFAAVRLYQDMLFGKVRNVDDMTNGLARIGEAAWAPARTTAAKNARRYSK